MAAGYCGMLQFKMVEKDMLGMHIKNDFFKDGLHVPCSLG
jgi:hypothetical protein